MSRTVHEPSDAPRVARTPSPTCSRRRFLHASGLLAALAWAAPAWARRGPRLASAFEQFLDTWRALAARELAADVDDEAGYVARLAAELSALELDEIPPRERVVFESDTLSTGPVWFERQLSVVALHLEPGAVLHPHNHPEYAVVTLGLRGSARFQHYELVGTPPAFDDHATPFEVRRTRAGVLHPGARTPLTRTRDNIHAFQAGADGAVLLDFAVQRGESDFGMLALDPGDDARIPPVHVARWRAKEF